MTDYNLGDVSCFIFDTTFEGSPRMRNAAGKMLSRAQEEGLTAIDMRNALKEGAFDDIKGMPPDVKDSLVKRIAAAIEKFSEK